jgi:large subunit ribosomal protein L25
MTTDVLIQGITRESFGTGASRSLRAEKMVPGVIYGKNKDQIHVALPAKEVNALANTFEFKTRPVTLEIGGKKYKVLPKEASLHPVTDNVEHLDFIFLQDGESIRVNVPVYYSNKDKSVGIKRGGALNAIFRNIKVEAKSNNVPEFLEIDLSGTVVGDVIRFADIKFPEGVRPLEKNMQVTVAKIVGKRSMQDPVEGAAEGEEAAEGESKVESSES